MSPILGGARFRPSTVVPPLVALGVVVAVIMVAIVVGLVVVVAQLETSFRIRSTADHMNEHIIASSATASQNFTFALRVLFVFTHQPQSSGHFTL